ncbi:MAG: non-canonical purine NTP diphosphatase [Flavobacteriales bacterium]|jgi:XTP/dITP diphosphohydrolase|tara:strand:- start:649 stop:1224 length:576 start_codon:yes stop_codon:yes gene_type:complete
MKIVFATNNINKIKEVQSLIPSHILLVSLESIGCHQEIPETQNTIEGNAIQKATYIKERYGLDCFADDTGLEVNALNGAPGVYSARYAGNERCSESNMGLLLTQLSAKKERTARFKTVIALYYQGELSTFKGICEGEITDVKNGSGGFGYDPIFKPLGYNKTFAELSFATKNEIGHRGKAVKKLVNYLNRL